VRVGLISGSIARPQMEKEYDVLNAFYCFISDAISGAYSAEEFSQEFGYTDPREGLKIWRACQRAYEKAERVIDGDLYDTANELSEIAG